MPVPYNNQQYGYNATPYYYNYAQGTPTNIPSFNQPSVTPVQNYLGATNYVMYPNVNVVWVTDPNEVTNYPVAPNSAVLLWDYIHAKVYLKQADATGRPTTKRYSLAEETDEKEDILPIPPSDDFKLSIDELKQDIYDLKNSIPDVSELLKDVETMKKDMYGIAGKKKTSHKPEDE